MGENTSQLFLEGNQIETNAEVEQILPLLCNYGTVARCKKLIQIFFAESTFSSASFTEYLEERTLNFLDDLLSQLFIHLEVLVALLVNTLTC